MIVFILAMYYVCYYFQFWIVCKYTLILWFVHVVGDIYEAQIWFDEEGLRIKRAMWLRDCSDNIQQCK